MALTFIARWPILPEKREQFMVALEELKNAFSPELWAGCKYVNLAWNREGHFIAQECWEDDDAINALRASPAFHESMRKMTACCGDKGLELEILEGFDGDPGVFDRYPKGIADSRYYPDLGSLTARVK